MCVSLDMLIYCVISVYINNCHSRTFSRSRLLSSSGLVVRNIRALGSCSADINIHRRCWMNWPYQTNTLTLISRQRSGLRGDWLQFLEIVTTTSVSPKINTPKVLPCTRYYKSRYACSRSIFFQKYTTTNHCFWRHYNDVQLIKKGMSAVLFIFTKKEICTSYE